jgi:hypothetical protein
MLAAKEARALITDPDAIEEFVSPRAPITSVLTNAVIRGAAVAIGVVPVGLNEIERQVLLRELAELSMELVELQRRAVRLSARLDREASEPLGRPA